MSYFLWNPKHGDDFYVKFSVHNNGVVIRNAMHSKNDVVTFGEKCFGITIEEARKTWAEYISDEWRPIGTEDLLDSIRNM